MRGKRRRRRKSRSNPTGEGGGPPRRSKLARALDRLKIRRTLRTWKREQQIAENREALNTGPDNDLRRWDALTAGLWAEAKAGRYQKDSRIRALQAPHLTEVGQRHGRPDLVTMAKKLAGAGKDGFWGVREATGETVIRLRDRSGLIKVDPAESRERTAELVNRVMPPALLCAKRGFELHKAVFSEPNIPAGQLAFGKKHIFDRFTRVILERDSSGQEIPRYLYYRHKGKTLQVPNPKRKFPEIIGAFAVQEDPLARSEHHWNTHLNLILIVDPGACFPLDEELWPDDPDNPGQVKPDPAAGVPGMFSWMKLAHVWGTQVEIRRLETSPTALRDELLEVIKYACKTVSEKSLEKFEAAAGNAHAGASPPAPAAAFELVGECEAEGPVCDVRRPAPAMIDWPDARVLEWFDANVGFRRVRGWGVLYQLGKIPRPTDPDEGIRWLGRIWVDPWKIVVQRDFFGEQSGGAHSWFNTGAQVPPITGPPNAQQPRAGPL